MIANRLARMDFQHFHVTHLYIFFLLSKVITAQNVMVGDTGLQLGITGRIVCSFDNGDLASLFWRAGEKDGTVVPTDSIASYNIINGIIISDRQKYNLTAEYELIIFNVTMADINTRYWCQATVDFKPGEDSKNAYQTVPKQATLQVDCGSECEEGDVVVCAVNGFTPQEEFDINWMVGGVEEPNDNITITLTGNLFNANSMLKIKDQQKETKLYTCEATGKAYKYAESGEYAAGKNITVKPNLTSSPPRTTERTTTLESTTMLSSTTASSGSPGGSTLRTSEEPFSTPNVTGNITGGSTLHTSEEPVSTANITESSSSSTKSTSECSEDWDCDNVTQKCDDEKQICICRNGYEFHVDVCKAIKMGLSDSQKLGIGMGVGMGCLLLLVGACAFMIYQKQRKKGVEPTDENLDQNVKNKTN